MDDIDIKKIIEYTVENMSVGEINIDVVEDFLGKVFSIQTKESGILIGSKGVNLIALNHIIKKIIDKKYPDKRQKFIIDVNNYQQNRNKEIKDKACVLAERVKSFDSDIEMEPMSPYERMVAHCALADNEDIETQSTGSGIDRHIVIRLKK